MKSWKYILLSVILFPLMGMVSSCSSETEVESEWHDWQARNDAATAQWAADNSLKKIKCYSKDPSVTGKNSDYIYVKVLEQGSGTESPLFTDTVRVAFQGRLIPSATYSKGFMFTYTYLGDFDWRTIGTSDGVTWRDGFYTAVQNMHIGDRWLVHIPYDLMYGAGSDTGYPAYSNMVFDIALVDFWHPGEKRPAFKSRQK
jgi:FKBP-type peptidyl-prolyl cis-trans isomerase FklB